METKLPKKPSHLKYLVSFGVFILLIVLTFYFLFRNIHFRELTDALRGVNPFCVILSLLLVVVYIGGEAVSLKLIIPNSEHKASFLSFFVYACVDFYFSAITPSATGGQPVQAYYMARDGIPVAKSSVALMLNTVTFKVVLMVLAAVALFCRPQYIFHNRLLAVMYFLDIAVSLAIMVFLVFAIFSKRLVQSIVFKCIYLLYKMRIIKNPMKKMRSARHQLADYETSARFLKKHPFVPLKMTLVCLVERVALFAISYVLYLGFGGRSASFFDLLMIQVVATVSVESLPLPGAVGASEMAILFLYGQIYEKHLQQPAMMLTRGVNFYFMVLLCSVFVLANHLRLLRLDRKKERFLKSQ